jgi:hypothetical protein
MKKSKITPVVWILLTTVSIFCYTYLHSAAVDEFGTCPSSFSVIDKTESEDVTKRESSVILPDIALAKKILNITKIVLPAD